MLVGACALAALVMHGALWVRMKTAGVVNDRARRLASRAWWAVLLLTPLVTLVTFSVQPQVGANLSADPWGFVFPLLAVCGLAGVRRSLSKTNEAHAFFASCAYLAGMLTSVVFGVYPMVLPARDPPHSLTVDCAKTGAHWTHGWSHMVDHWHDSGGALLHDCVPVL